MSLNTLLDPILQDGIQSVNFFNGRLLSGEDLTKEQQANRTGHRLLGQALGAGVANGLEVSRAEGVGNQPILAIQPGLAVNRLGETVRLGQLVKLALVKPTETNSTTSNGSPFSPCGQAGQAGVYVKDAGIYLLTIAPAWGREGSAPVSGLNNSPVDCNTKYLVEGVQFQLHALNLNVSAAGLPRLRNQVAGECFGGAEWFLTPRPLAVPPDKYGLVEKLKLTDCEVPLAVLHWTDSSAGLGFVDRWSVRRRLRKPEATARWRVVAGDRRLAEAEAIFLQFQEQLESLQQDGVQQSLAAEVNFVHLPAAGYLPIGAGGFDWRLFLGPLAPVAVKQLDAGLLRSIIARSFLEDPLQVGSFANALKAGGTPPPVEVFQVPGENGFVVFARSRQGRIRVFLTPPNVKVAPGEIYARQALTTTQLNAASNDSGPLVIDDLPPGDYQVAASIAHYQTVAPQTVTTVGGRTTDVSFSLKALADGRLRINVTDVDGTVWPGVHISLIGKQTGFRLLLDTDAAGQCIFTNLPADTYNAIAGIGHVPRKTLRDIVIEPGADETRTIALSVSNDFKEPPRVIEYAKIKTPALGSGQFTIMPELAEQSGAMSAATRTTTSRSKARQKTGSALVFKSAAYEEKAAYQYSYGKVKTSITVADQPWSGMQQIEPSTAPLAAWLLEWQAYLAEIRNEPEIAKVTPLIYADRQYEAAQGVRYRPRQWQAFAVFGALGIPLTVAPAGQITKLPHELDKVKVWGIDDERRAILRESGIIYLDQFAVLPEEVVVDLLGYPPEFVRPLLGQAAELVKDVNAQLAYYDGLDTPTKDVLRAHGLLDDVALANANQSALKKLLGDTLSAELQAASLIAQARLVVPIEAWSLEPLGFTSNQLGALVEKGVASQQDFVTRASADADGLAALTGASKQQVTDLQRTAVERLAASSIRHSALDNLQALPGVNAAVVGKLNVANLDSMEKLANAPAAEIAQATGLSEAAAGQLKADAANLRGAGLAVGALAAINAQETVALHAAGVRTAADLANKDAGALAAAFNGDVVRATAVLAGVRRGLGMR